VSATEITSVARVVAGYETFEDVRYRIRIVERNRKRGLVDGMIEAPPAVISALYDTGECAIELPGELGWFTFVVTDVRRGAIKLIGRAKIDMRP
jgi:hypothetical protein